MERGWICTLSLKVIQRRRNDVSLSVFVSLLLVVNTYTIPNTSIKAFAHRPVIGPYLTHVRAARVKWATVPFVLEWLTHYKADLHHNHREGFYTFLILTNGRISAHLSEMIVFIPDTTSMPTFLIHVWVISAVNWNIAGYSQSFCLSPVIFSRDVD